MTVFAPSRQLLGYGTGVRTALEAPEDGEQTVLDAGTRSPIVTYPDEILEEAVDKMVQQGAAKYAAEKKITPRDCGKEM